MKTVAVAGVMTLLTWSRGRRLLGICHCIKLAWKMAAAKIDEADPSRIL